MFGLTKQQVLGITDCLSKMKRKEIERVVSGKIKYFNTKICRYCVFYKDESIDVMGISDIDGVHIILI